MRPSSMNVPRLTSPLKAAGQTKLFLPMLGLMTLQLSGLSGLLGGGQGSAVEKNMEPCERQRARFGSACRSLDGSFSAADLGLATKGPGEVLDLPDPHKVRSDLQYSGPVSCRQKTCLPRCF